MSSFAAPAAIINMAYGLHVVLAAEKPMWR
jgi:hypothetical protein